MAQEAQASAETQPAEAQEAKAPESKEGQEPQGEAKTEPKTFDADYVKQLREEAAKHRKEAQEAKAKAQEYEDSQKSELEKANTKAERAEKAKAEAEARLLRFEVAKEKEVPAEAVDLLNGNTREELEASADKILSLVKNRTDTDKKPDFDGGPREPAPDSKTPEEAHNESILGLVGLKPS